MITKILTVSELLTNQDQQNIEIAASIIKEGRLVAFPTETVYGLGANAYDSKAADKIYKAKGRPQDNPLIVHLADVSDINTVCKNVSKKAHLLIKHFCPGPLTIILEKNEMIPLSVTGGLATVGVRFPKNNIARMLIKKARVPICAPSANVSGKPSGTAFEHVLSDLDGKIDAILNNSEICEIGLESTIIDMTLDAPTILRPGAITKDNLEEVVGKCEIGYGLLMQNGAPRAPGMKYRHYAPNATITIVKGNNEAVRNKICELVNGSREKVGVLCGNEAVSFYSNICQAVLTADKLFYSLRSFDDLGIKHIYSEIFDDEALMNRLLKAADGNVLEV